MLYMSFRLVQKSLTLYDLEPRNGLILRYFTEFGSFRAHCIKVVVKAIRINNLRTITMLSSKRLQTAE